MPNEIEIEKREKGFILHLFSWIAVAFGVMAIYVLSYGPVVKYTWGRGLTRGAFVQTLYIPVEWLCQQTTFAEQFMDFYVEKVWGVDLFLVDGPATTPWSSPRSAKGKAQG